MSRRLRLGVGPITTPTLSHEVARWHVLLAMGRLGAAGPLAALRGLLPRGPWAIAGAAWDNPDEVARLKPAAAKLHRWATARGLFDELPLPGLLPPREPDGEYRPFQPLGVAPRQAATLALWARQVNLAVPWVVRAGWDLLCAWEADPRAAAALDVRPGMRGLGYFTPRAPVDPVTWTVEVPDEWEPVTPTRERRLPLVKRFEALIRFQAGVSVRSLAAELGIDRRALARHLAETAEAAGLPLRKGGT